MHEKERNKVIKVGGAEGQLGRDERKRKFKKKIVISGYRIEQKGI